MAGPRKRLHTVRAQITDKDHPMCGEAVVIRWTDDVRGRPLMAVHVEYGGRLVPIADMTNVLATASPKTEGEAE